MMPKRIADTPSAQPITEFIGSGPFSSWPRNSSPA